MASPTSAPMTPPTPALSQPPPPHGNPSNPIKIESDSDSDTTPTTEGNNPSKFTLNDLEAAVTTYSERASYCLGGHIPISLHPDNAKNPPTSAPVVLRFDTSRPSTPSSQTSTPTPSPSTPHPSIQKVQFPLPKPRESTLQPLLAACSPASFGRAGADVLDETYRKAGKLDADRFSTNFHPADYGVLDAIAQVLLPGLGIQGGLEGRDEHAGVRAELYKLNVYSGPSGQFKKHVDTPRGATQFGSLVVCLPCVHEGGQLLISHSNHTSKFDWSTTSTTSTTSQCTDGKDKEKDTITWCAFYSDCEHEVLPVTSGHRVTLTYNLYISEHVGGILQRFPSADPSLYPLFESARNMLGMKEFMPGGGTIGFYCAHQYAHTRKVTDQLMPYALKGIDAILFAVFGSLGLDVNVKPVLDDKSWDEDDDDDYAFDRYRDEWSNENNGRRASSETASMNSVDGPMSFDEWKQRRENEGKLTRFGANFAGLGETDEREEGYGARRREMIQSCWTLEEVAGVRWLNGATKEGWTEAMAHLAYGNEASLEWSYSHAAIFIDIPALKERKTIPEKGFRLPVWHDGEVDVEEDDDTDDDKKMTDMDEEDDGGPIRPTEVFLNKVWDENGLRMER